MTDKFSSSAEHREPTGARGKLRALAAAAGIALAGAGAEAIASEPDRGLMAAIEDAISAAPEIKGVCSGVAMASMQAAPGTVSIAYPVAEGTSEDQLKAAIQDCLDWDYARSDDPGRQNFTIVPMQVTEVELTRSGARITVMPNPTGEAVVRETRASLLREVFGASAAHAALPDAGVEAAEDQPKIDHLATLVGPEEAMHIRAALTECMAEVADIASDFDDIEERAEFVAEFEADCAEGQQRDVQIAILDREIAQKNATQAELRAETARLRAEGVALDETLAALETVNGQITDTLIEAALCEIAKKPENVCAAIDAKLEDILDRADAIAKRFHTRPAGDKVSSLVTPKS